MEGGEAYLGREGPLGALRLPCYPHRQDEKNDVDAYANVDSVGLEEGKAEEMKSTP